jgi:uncharacterized protein (DUF433 family)
VHTAAQTWGGGEVQAIGLAATESGHEDAVRKVKYMGRMQEAEKLLSGMTRGEKAQVLQWVARDLGDAFPGIDTAPDVCGGEPRIVRTRIPVWVLVQARRLGTSEAELLRCYPTLRAEDLANAWAYYRTHRDEIEQQIRENEEA